MRILFVSTAGRGHVQPMLPLALALQARTHAVVWATGADALPLLAAHGIDTVEAGPPFHATVLAYHRSTAAETQPPGGRRGARHAFGALFGQMFAPPMLATLQPWLREWRPQLLIHEPAALAAPLLSAAQGVPRLTHAFGVPIPGPVLAAAAEALEAAWRAQGLMVPADAGVYGAPSIEIAPPSLLARAEHMGASVRLWRRPGGATAAPNQATNAGLQAWLDAADPRPRIYATFGTLNPGGAAFSTLIDALPQLRVRVARAGGPVATRGPHGRWPAHWLVSDYLPQDSLLPYCAAVVSHGGAGTMLSALSHGLPQLCLPFGADHYRNSDALAACGAARVIDLASVATSPGQLAEAVLDVLHDTALRANTRRLQSEIDAMPSAEELAVQIETMLVR